MPRNIRRRSPIRPDFDQLETFLKVAELGSFAAAAHQLGISQPAVSQSIARLEALYGGDLFERRRGAPIALTPIGRAILPKARLLLFTADQQINRAISTAQSYDGLLRIGFYTGISKGPLSNGLAEFRASRPDVDLRIFESSPANLYRELNERSLDIVFSCYFTDSSNGTNLQERVWEEPIVVALQESHPLATKDSLSWVEFSTLPLMMRSHGGDLTPYRAIASRIGDLPFNCELHDVSRGALIESKRGLEAADQAASR